jgi:hypothetical protein
MNFLSSSQTLQGWGLYEVPQENFENKDAKLCSLAVFWVQNCHLKKVK